MLTSLLKLILPGKWRLDSRATLKLHVHFASGGEETAHFSVLFFTKENGKRKYTITYPPETRHYSPKGRFANTTWNGDIEAWMAGGNMPGWADDILQERLSM